MFDFNSLSLIDIIKILVSIYQLLQVLQVIIGFVYLRIKKMCQKNKQEFVMFHKDMLSFDLSNIFIVSNETDDNISFKLIINDFSSGNIKTIDKIDLIFNYINRDIYKLLEQSITLGKPIVEIACYRKYEVNINLEINDKKNKDFLSQAIQIDGKYHILKHDFRIFINVHFHYLGESKKQEGYEVKDKFITMNYNK